MGVKVGPRTGMQAIKEHQTPPLAIIDPRFSGREVRRLSLYWQKKQSWVIKSKMVLGQPTSRHVCLGAHGQNVCTYSSGQLWGYVEQSKAISLFNVRSDPQTAGSITPPNLARYLQLPSERATWPSVRTYTRAHTQCVWTRRHTHKEPPLIYNPTCVAVLHTPARTLTNMGRVFC